jgi:dTDP-4-amino-4,6-dideoxygalactose transaminase
MEWKVRLAEIDIGDKEKRAISRVIDSQWLTMGERTLEFERLFAEIHNAKYAVAVSSCTAALHLALKAVGVGSGDEVICPSMTFVASSNAALYLGAVPVFADIISLDNPTISPDDIRQKISPRTKAIVVMHYGGYSCEIESVMHIAQEHSIPVIEDAAHSPAVKRGKKFLGTFGKAGCFSFYANKNITTAEGGMIITDDKAIAQEASRNRSHGISHLAHERFTAGTVGYDVSDLGYNYRIDEIRAAMGIVQLGKLKRGNLQRRKIVNNYLKLLCEEERLIVPFSDKEGESAYHLLGIVLNGKGLNRDAVIAKMREKRVQVSNHYPPVHLFSYYRKRFGMRKGLLPVTEEFGRRQITLPLYAGMTESDVNYVADSVRKAIRY